MWYEKYVGIPFKPNGRDETGLDCWGLARLVYEKEFNIKLPSFSTEYIIDDHSRIEELINQYKEGWEEVTTPTEGCGVLFNIFGELTHIGIMVSETEFLHVRRGSNAVIDSVTDLRWKNRVLGFFKYSAANQVALTAIPHPLKTQRLVTVVPEGINLEELYDRVNKENSIDSELSKKVTILVNGMPIPRTGWSTTVLSSTDTVEYRAVPGEEFVKMAIVIVIAIYAPEIAYYIGQSIGAIDAAVAFKAFAATTAGKLAAAAVIVAGSYLVNAIAPIRPPSTEDPGSPEQQNLISGTSNAYNPYGNIPVVLGKIRYTPPLGAKGFITYGNSRESKESFLHSLLIWGYGPLTLTDFKIGETPFSDYQFNTGLGGPGVVTLDRKTVPSAEDLVNFNKIYGNDVEPIYVGIEMVGPNQEEANENTGNLYTENERWFGTKVVRGITTWLDIDVQYNPLTGETVIDENTPDVILEETAPVEAPGY